MPPMTSPDDIAQNMPNASMMYSTFTPVFGNLAFQLSPSQTGEVNFSYGTMPHFSLEGLLYMQQVQSATEPTQVLPGTVSGQQNVGGQVTVTGAAGNLQVAIGNATQQSGSF